ncbi:type III-D CRISPR-associated protein Csx19 [Calditrichota bacterium LG25]
MEKNGLKLLKDIKSEVTLLGEIENLFDAAREHIQKKSSVVLYLDYEVRIGEFENGSIRFFHEDSFDPKFVQRMRIFNKDEELYIWRSGKKLFGRFRRDGKGDVSIVVEANQVLFGTFTEVQNGWTLLSEKRGTFLIIPGEFEANERRKRVAIRTRNYIGFMEEKGFPKVSETMTAPHQATYRDHRFVEFIQLHE